MKHAMCNDRKPVNEYKQMLIVIYNELCTAITAYEAAEDSEDYDKGYALYEEIADIEERLGSFID